MLGVGVGPDGSGGGGGNAPPPAAASAPSHRMRDDDRDALAILLSVNGLGPLTLGRLVEGLGSPGGILETAAAPGGPAALVEASRAADGEWRAMPQAVAEAVGAAA